MQRREPSPPEPPPPLTFSVLSRYGAPAVDAYRPAAPHGPEGWRFARRLLEPHLRTLDLAELKPVGEGATGWVFQAWQPRLARAIAVKVGKATLDPDAFDPLHRQGAAMAHLRHTSVPHVCGAGRLGSHGPGYLLLEWVDGTNLETAFARQRGIPAPPQRLRFWSALRDAAAVLAFAHARGHAHGDIRLANLVLPDDPGRAAVLLDWTGAAADADEVAADRMALYTLLQQVAARFPAAETDGDRRPPHTLSELTAALHASIAAAERAVRGTGNHPEPGASNAAG